MWNNHGGFDGGYGGGTGGGGGGGYMQSPGGFGSPAPTQGEKKSRARTQQIVPCTVSQLLSATQSDELFKIGEVELSQVTIVGIVRHAEKAPTNILYKVDDMTAAPMDVRQWVDTDGTHVREPVSVQIKKFQQEFYKALKEVEKYDRSSKLTVEEAILVYPEIVSDVARIVTAMPPTQEASCESVVVPPGSYVKVSGHLRSFQNKKSVVAFKIAPVEDMNEFVSHMLEVVHSHMSLNAQPGSGGPSLALNTPGRASSDTAGSFSAGNDMHTNGLTPHQGQILNLIRSCKGSEGMGFEDLKSRLHGMNVNTIKQALEFLSNEGHIYSTVDDDHYKSTDGD